MVHLCFNESLCKTVKWHRVPVLSYRWWISALHAEQSVIIQLTSKSSHSGIAQGIFWDIWDRTESIDSSEVSSLMMQGRFRYQQAQQD